MSTDLITTDIGDFGFNAPKTKFNLSLGLLQTCQQAHEELGRLVFSQTFAFANLDDLLSFLEQGRDVEAHLKRFKDQRQSRVCR